MASKNEDEAGFHDGTLYIVITLRSKSLLLKEKLYKTFSYCYDIRVFLVFLRVFLC